MEIDLPQKSLLEFAPERNPFRFSGLSRAAARPDAGLAENDVVDFLICD